jgi:hypothetical protein
MGGKEGGDGGPLDAREARDHQEMARRYDLTLAPGPDPHALKATHLETRRALRRTLDTIGVATGPPCSRIRLEEFVDHSHELVWVRPDERVVSALDNDELRARNAVVEHLRVVDWHRLIVRGGGDERRTCDLGQAASAVERHRFVPRGQHQLAILVRDEVNDRIGTFLIDLR